MFYCDRFKARQALPELYAGLLPLRDFEIQADEQTPMILRICGGV